mmetsp:Transcript_30348/g.46444  ORF Transcript_30348/g.46444 Transcript_30348/m.46444 type:complete len:81 (-) Transcript_30348:757-999(-)
MGRPMMPVPQMENIPNWPTPVYYSNPGSQMSEVDLDTLVKSINMFERGQRDFESGQDYEIVSVPSSNSASNDSSDTSKSR